VSTHESFKARFSAPNVFRSAQGRYHLAPFRFARIPGVEGKALLVNELGEFHFLDEPTFRRFCDLSLDCHEDEFFDLRSKHFLLDDHAEAFWPFAVSQYRTRKSFICSGPALHIFVVTLRCEHSCPYCQVSRQTGDAGAFDMSAETARHAVDRLFEAPSRDLKVEFQGGEPLLAFDRLRWIVELIEQRNATELRNIDFVIATTLNDITPEQLEFCRAHRVSLSTSIDGPEALHNRNRPRRGRDGFQRTVAGIEAARGVLGNDAVSALTTITRESLSHPEAIIDTYVALNFSSIFLRQLSPYGFARLTGARIGYSVEDFILFYQRALAHLVKINLKGRYMEETYTSILLQHILTPFPTGYVDLRSPTGAVLGALVYNYDGAVYASDEGRMLAETGDFAFRLGAVDQSYRALMNSPAAQAALAAGVAESLVGCCDCAFLPYCGADPVFHHAEQGTLRGHRPTSPFCQKQSALFQFLFRELHDGNTDTVRVLTSWLARRPISDIGSISAV